MYVVNLFFNYLLKKLLMLNCSSIISFLYKKMYFHRIWINNWIQYRAVCTLAEGNTFSGYWKCHKHNMFWIGRFVNLGDNWECTQKIFIIHVKTFRILQQTFYNILSLVWLSKVELGRVFRVREDWHNIINWKSRTIQN